MVPTLSSRSTTKTPKKKSTSTINLTTPTSSNFSTTTTSKIKISPTWFYSTLPADPFTKKSNLAMGSSAKVSSGGISEISAKLSHTCIPKILCIGISKPKISLLPVTTTPNYVTLVLHLSLSTEARFAVRSSIWLLRWSKRNLMTTK